jgi:hypothetical protein
MDKIVNHQTKKAHKAFLRHAVEMGRVPTPSEPFEVPVFTVTNRESTLFERLYENTPMVEVVKVEGVFNWWVKLEETMKAIERYRLEGHEFAIYLDSDDAFVWQAPKVLRCRELLPEGIDILFQRSNHGFPRYEMFRGNMMRYLGHNGPCAGAFIARTQNFKELFRLIKQLSQLRAPYVYARNSKGAGLKRHKLRIFDDQGAWKTLTVLLPHRLLVDADVTLTREMEPNFDEIL